MAVSKSYSRHSIILTEQDGGFRADNSKVAAGYSKIEVKKGNCILTAFAQNLKYFADGSYIYKFFIAKTDPQPVLLDLGTLVIDDRGKGEGVWKFDAQDVGKTGCGIDKFNLFGVMARKEGNGAKGLVCPLAGSTGKMPDRWREVLASSLAGCDAGDSGDQGAEGQGGYTGPAKGSDEGADGFNGDIPVFQDVEVPAQQTENIEGEKAQEAEQESAVEEEVEEILPDEDYAGAADGQEGYAQEQDVSCGAAGGDVETAEKAAVEGVHDSGLGDLSWEDMSPGLQEYMSYMLDSFPRVEPFEVPIGNCVWWKINTFNYIFGIMNDSARKLMYYAYGVPGLYSSQMKKQMEMYGFYSWRPAKGESNRQGGYGYWLAFVDARTGQLANLQV